MVRRREGRPPYVAVLAVLLALLFVAFVFGATLGAVDIGFWDAFTTLLTQVPLLGPLLFDSTATAREVNILEGVRFPRVFVAAAAGAGLGLAGTLLSGAFRNRLAEPTTTGGAAGALLGASIFLFIGPTAAFVTSSGTTSLLGLLARGLVAAAGAWAATLLVFVTARSGGTVGAAQLLLGGLALNALVGAAAALFLFLGEAGPQAAATVVVSWMFGGLLAQEAGPGTFWPVVDGVFLALGASAFVFRELDQMLLGDEEAAAAGVDVRRARHVAIFAAALATGFAVAHAGVIAFVGLLAPNLLRRWTGPTHERLAPASMLVGATLLVVADALGRLVARPGELPAGVVTAALGAPLLLLLLARTLKEAAS